MAEDDAYRTDDPKAVKARKQEQKNAQNLEVEDLKWLMQQPQFRRFLWHLLMFCNVFSVSPQTAQEREVGMHDGARNIGLKYFADVQEHCLEDYGNMSNEAKKKGNAYDD